MPFALDPGMREGIRQPKFADRFFRIDFDASPMPVLCLFPIPEPLSLSEARIEICGLDCQRRSIRWELTRSLPRVRLEAPLICQIFNWSQTVVWEGIRLVDFLDHFKLDAPDDGFYAVYSRDGIYFERLTRPEARDPGVLLATGLNGEPLPEPHGGPIRLVVPFLQGYMSVKWVGAIRAFAQDPIGIKRLLAQSATAELNEEWKKRYGIVPPPTAPAAPPVPALPKGAAPPPAPEFSPVTAGFGEEAPRAAAASGVLREIIAIVRPQKHAATREALEAAGVFSYTTVVALGRSRQRGLRFKSPAASAAPNESDVAIRFLPKRYFSIVVAEDRVEAAIEAIVRTNRTGKGVYGDGKIFVLGVEGAIRISSDERGVEAV